MNFPPWVTNVAIVGLIFSIGGYVTRLEYGMAEINKTLANQGKKIVALDTAISIHHGSDWSTKVENNTLKKVDDLEGKIGDIEKSFDGKLINLDHDFDSTVKNLDDLQARVRAVNSWTQQGDKIIINSRLEPVRALANFARGKIADSTRVLINKQHRLGRNYKIGDNIVLKSAQPPSLEVETIVSGYLDDTEHQDILVQINESLLDALGLDEKQGRYELYVQAKPEALRWKTLDELYKEEKKSGR